MTELKKRIHDDKNGLDYVLVGDYYIPEITLGEIDERPIGRYGRMHRAYLEEHNPVRLNELILSCQLHTYLADLNEQATELRERIIEQMKAAEGVNEELKMQNPMYWVQCMNSIRNRAEEIVNHELIYC